MLKIRMQRIGKINQPAFRIVVVEHTESPKTGNFVDKVGTYNPKTKERKLDAERIKYWLSKGAQASGTVYNMLISAGIIEGKKKNVLPKKSPPKKDEPAAEAAASAAAETLSAEAPAKEEAPSEAPAKEETASTEAPTEKAAA